MHFELWFARGAGARPPPAAWGVLDRDAALAGLADSIRSLGAFTGADTVSVGRVAPSSLRGPLTHHLQESSGKGRVNP